MCWFVVRHAAWIVSVLFAGHTARCLVVFCGSRCLSGLASRFVDVCLGFLVFSCLRERRRRRKRRVSGGGGLARFAEAEKAHTALCLRAAAS